MEPTHVIAALLGLAVACLWVGLVVRQRQLAAVRSERDQALHDLAAVQARAEERERARQELDADREGMATFFKGLTADALENNRKQLLDAAKGLFDEKHELSKSEISSLMKPVGTQLDKLETRVREMDSRREVLSSHVGDLTDVTSGLRDLLRSSQGRGSWAEHHVRNVLELAGLTNRCDFNEQTTVGGNEATRRPDVVVNMPGGAKVVIDAKAPQASYEQAQAEDDDDRRQEHLNRHAESMMTHARVLGKRDYHGLVKGSLDFVVMYVPSDATINAAMDVRPNLWDDAWKQHRVLITSPGLLLALLRTVALIWQRQDIQDNAAEISKIGRQLFDSIKTYAKHVTRVGNGLRTAASAYNDSIGTLETTMLNRATTLTELGAAPTTEEIAQPERVETNIRRLTKLDPAVPDAGPEALSA
jgi:DNA recombination protein RmuC